MQRLRQPVAELLGRPGAARVVDGQAELGDLLLEVTNVGAGPGVELQLTISAILEGLSVKGSVIAPWHGGCRRCLEPVGGTITPDVDEIFTDDPVEGETRPIVAEHIDLEPLVREAVMLALPLAPLCGDDCAGPDPDRYPTATPQDTADAKPAGDPRWAALDALTFDDVDLTD